MCILRVRTISSPPIGYESRRRAPSRLTPSRILAPPGQIRVACDTIVADSGKPDRVDLSAEQHAVGDLPHDALVYLLASRYCETDLMMDKAWELFGHTPPGWRRVQSICDFVHSHTPRAFFRPDRILPSPSRAARVKDDASSAPPKACP
jgi:hypothetical protein